MTTQLKPQSTSEIVGELVAWRNLANMQWDKFEQHMAEPEGPHWREAWKASTRMAAEHEFRLYQHMKQHGLVQAVCDGYRARIEQHDGHDWIALFRVTEDGEERVE